MAVTLFDDLNNVVNTFSTIQEAVDAASSGYRIVLDAGTYNENVAVDVQVTIEGANAGTAYDGSRTSESEIVGQIYVHADGTTIDGVQITNGANVGGVPAGIYVDVDNVTITNSVFVGDGTAGMSGVLTPFGGDVTGLALTNSSFTGWYWATYFNPTAEFNVDGNLFEDNGLVGDDFADTSTITNNTFNGSGAGIGYGVFDTTDNLGANADGTNTFSNAGNNGIYLYGDGDAGGQTVIGTQFDDYFTDMYKYVAGSGDDDQVEGGGGNDYFEMTSGNDTMLGGEGNDTFVGADSADSVDGGNGIDEVRTTQSFVLGTGVENLTLLDLATNVEDFEDFDLGPIANGENGWSYAGTSDQEVVADGGDQAFRMSSDPSTGAFGGPYAPILGVTAGESTTTAGADSMRMTFTLKAVLPGDDSRLELDFGNQSRTDRINFMVIENTDAGIRFATAEPQTDGNWETGAVDNTFTAFTGNRTIVEGLDNTVEHEVTLVLNFVDGSNNDVISIYVDGEKVGETTTFENYRQFHVSEAHATAQQNNQGATVFFRNSGSGAPTDGPNGSVNEGFLIDDIAYSSFDAAGPSGTGNELANLITGNSGDNALSGLGEDDTLDGGIGDDTLDGGAGDDVLTGAEGTDTAVYTGALDASDFSYDGGTNTWTVDATDTGEGTDALTGMEAVAGADPDGAGGSTGRFLLVDENGSYTSIQAAIDAAVDGDTILIAAGTYEENVVVDKQVTLLGLGDGDDVVIQGSFKADNSIGGGTTVGDWIEDKTAYNGNAGSGLTVAADDVTIRNLKIAEFTYGVNLGTNDGLTIEDVTFDENLIGIYKQDGVADVTNFSLLGGAIEDGYQGMVINAADGGSFDQVTIDGTTFQHLTWKGIYAEQLSNADLLNLTMNDVGQFGRSLVTGGTKGADGSAIELNLKYDSFSNVNIENFNLTDVGLSNGGGSPHANGAAIAIKARDDGSYGGDPATLSGVTIQNGSIDGTSVGVRIGEPGKTNAGPSGVQVTDVSITNEATADVDNVSQSTMTINMLDGGDEIDVAATSTGNFAVNGGDGNDTIDAGAGSDTVNGGAGDDDLNGAEGTDTAVYAGALDASDFSYDGGTNTWTVDATGSGEGTDALTGMEAVAGADPDGAGGSTGRFLLVDENGSYTTIQAAVDAALDGDTILIAAGTYEEQVVIDGMANLTLQSVGGAVTIKAPAGALAVTGHSDHWGDDVRAIVTVNSSTNVTLQGITVDGDFAADRTPGSNGDEISGIAFLHSSGAVNDSFVTNTGNSTGGGLFGLQHGSGIIVDNGTDSAGTPITIDNTTIDNFQKTGLLVWNAAVALTDNTITGIGATGLTAQNGIQIGSSSGTVSGNDISGVAYSGGVWASSGIIAYEPSDDLAFTGNGITGAAGGSTVGIDLSDVANGTTVTITGNDFDTLDYGIYAYTYDDAVGLDSDPVTGSNTFANISVEGVHLDPEESYGDPFSTSTAFAESGSDFTDVLRGSDGNDSFSGLGGADELAGRGGDDSLNGGDDGDSLDGGDGTDTAAYTQAITTAMLSESGGNWTVTTGGAEGTDTLADVEIVDGAEAGKILLVGSGGYATIQEAVDAADAGDTIMVGAGTFAGATITKELTIVGSGIGNTIITSGLGSAGFDLSGNIDATSGGSATVTISGFTFTGNSVGVRGASNIDLDHLVVQNSHFEQNKIHGIGTGSGAFGLSDVQILDSSFVRNGDGSANGDGDIVLFGFTGDALIQNVTIEGGANAIPTNANADTAIQITGRDPSTYDVVDPIGNVVFDNVDVTGSYAKVIVYIQGYTNLDGLDFNANGTTIDGHAGWGYGLYIDTTGGVSDAGNPAGVPGQPGFFDITAAGALAPNNVDLTNVTLGNDIAINVAPGHPYYALNGQAFDSVLVGTPVADDFIGSAGRDLLIGGAGNDTLAGGDGNDAYIIDGGETLVEGAAGGTDTVYSSITHTLATDFENLTLLGTADIDGTGNSAANVINGNTGNNVLAGLAGADTLNGGDGTDTADYSASAASVAVSLGAGVGIGGDADGDLYSSIENLIGSAAADILVGDDGDNVIAGLAGGDTINGGLGNDTVDYSASNNQVVIDLSTLIGGFVKPAGGHATGDSITGIENVIGTDFTDTLIGNASANLLIAGLKNDTLNGMGGDDTMDGGDGNDTYTVDSAGDVILDSSGVELVNSSVTYTLSAALENLTLTGALDIDGTGNGTGNTIRGNSGANELFGLGGKDIISGLGGHDTIDGGDGGDELAGNGGDDSLIGGIGSDKLRGDAGNDTLSGGLDADQLYGGDNNDQLDGGDGNDLLFGDAHNDVLNGGDGNDELDGGTGADTMEGGEGNDTYTVNDLGDVVTEAISGPAGGTDAVKSSVSFTLGANIENLSLTGSGDTYGYGNGENNIIVGTGGHNHIMGNGGVDKVNAGNGNDTVEGGSEADVINGQGGEDSLYGDDGDDQITGGTGTDHMWGGTGSDKFIYLSAAEAGNGVTRDVIEDFESVDVINLKSIDAINGGSDNAFTFIATGAFTLAGQLRYFDDGSGNTIIEGNTDGNAATVEFQIELRGYTGGLTFNDFVF